ncbi:MAG TPA: hypothetical protein VES42_13545 [Pilimelia sp.]|nr:hypothetical protein [Pilimelia sp.]
MSEVRQGAPAPPPGRPPTVPGPTVGPATVREDVVTVLLGACLIAGALADGWAHANIVETLEGFFTPWHALLYGGLSATAAWTFWLAYRRRVQAPRWWRDGWPAGYRAGALGVLLFVVGGLADMVWHETLGVEVGLNAAFSPSHMLIDVGAILMVTSPLRSSWANPNGRLRAAAGVGAATLGAMGATILLSHSSALLKAAPTVAYDVERDQGGGAELLAIAGVGAYVVSTLLLAIPLLLVHRRRATAGAGTAIVAGVSLFTLIMFEFPSAATAGALGALLGAALADVLLHRLDAARGPAAWMRLPVAGALFAMLVWSGQLLGLYVEEGVRWPAEMWTGIVTLCGLLGALLGGLAAGPGDRAPTGPGRPA